MSHAGTHLERQLTAKAWRAVGRGCAAQANLVCPERRQFFFIEVDMQRGELAAVEPKIRAILEQLNEANKSLQTQVDTLTTSGADKDKQIADLQQQLAAAQANTTSSPEDDAALADLESIVAANTPVTPVTPVRPTGAGDGASDATVAAAGVTNANSDAVTIPLK